MSWEHMNAKFDTVYTDLKKSESTNILAIEVRQHLIYNYQKHIKISLIVPFWTHQTVGQDSSFLT